MYSIVSIRSAWASIGLGWQQQACVERVEQQHPFRSIWGRISSKLLIKYSGPPLVESHHWNRKSHRRSSSVRVSEQSQQPCTRTTSLQFLHLLGNAVLALIDVRSSSRSRANARKISNRIGASLDDSSAAGTSGADQVQSTLCS